MTLGFGLFTLGTIFIFTAIKNMSVPDLLLGRSPSQTTGEIFTGSIESGGGVSSNGRTSGGKNKEKGLGHFDGKRVCKWIIPELKKARRSGDWRGKVISGYRSNSEQAAACAGTSGPCAPPGQSMHQGTAFPKCAVDVTDPQGLDRALKRQGSPLKGFTVANDAPHFSTGG